MIDRASTSALDVRLLRDGDDDVLARVADGVFDNAVSKTWSREFLADPRHHLFVACADGLVVGMVSAVHYVHPDKAPQLWINEIGVAPSHQGHGVGRRLLDAMLAHGRAIGCSEAWLGTEETNVAARRLYESAGGVPESFVLYEWQFTPAASGTRSRTSTEEASA